MNLFDFCGCNSRLVMLARFSFSPNTESSSRDRFLAQYQIHGPEFGIIDIIQRELLSSSSQFHLADETQIVNEKLHSHGRHPRHPMSPDLTTRESLPRSRILNQTLFGGGGRHQLLTRLPAIVSLLDFQPSPIQN